jgi:hypothetical protein
MRPCLQAEPITNRAAAQQQGKGVGINQARLIESEASKSSQLQCSITQVDNEALPAGSSTNTNTKQGSMTAKQKCWVRPG